MTRIKLAPRVCAALLAAAPAALAAGLGVPDLGAASLGQGAATIAAPDDLFALYYNPAALAGHPGLRLLVDGRGIQHRETFQRLQADGSNPDNFVSVSNAGRIRMSPAFFAAYGITLGGMPVTFAAGGYPATGYSGYSFPDPAVFREQLGTCPTCNTENARQTPQRYSLISNGSSSFTIALGGGIQLTDWLRAGIAIQDQMVTLKTRQSIGANPFAAGEFPGYDAVLSVDAKNGFTPTASLGLSAALGGDFRVGSSFQLPYNVKAHGTLGVEVPQVLATVGATVSGDQTDVELHLPWYLRGGVRWVRPAVELELAFTWDGWSRYREVTFRPQNVSFQVKGNTVNIPDIHLVKGMKDSQSLRLGATLHAGEFISPALSWLTLRAGAVGETSAVPDERIAIDQAHWQRVGLSVGATVKLAGFSLTAGYLRYFMPSKQVRTSLVLQPAPLRPEAEATVVGNGDYSAAVDLVGVSLAWSGE